jgi:hypothetical protein
VLRRLPRDLALALAGFGWVGLGLLLDHDAGVWRQRAIGIVTWALVAALLAGESRAVRAQVVLVIVAATCVEYAASVGLGLYTYRLGNVPLYVPPGHGLVYLSAIALGRSRLFADRRRLLVSAALAAAGTWALAALLGPRHDVLGAVLFVFFARFCLAGRAPLVYCGAFLLTSYLELLGTGLGSWTWARHTAGGLIPMGNPPSVIAGAYCFLDLFGLAVAPRLVALGSSRLSGLLDRRHRQPEAEQPLVVVLGSLPGAAPDHGASAPVDPVGEAQSLLVADVG